MGVNSDTHPSLTPSGSVPRPQSYPDNSPLHGCSLSHKRTSSYGGNRDLNSKIHILNEKPEWYLNAMIQRLQTRRLAWDTTTEPHMSRAQMYHSRKQFRKARKWVPPAKVKWKRRKDFETLTPFPCGKRGSRRLRRRPHLIMHNSGLFHDKQRRFLLQIFEISHSQAQANFIEGYVRNDTPAAFGTVYTQCCIQ